MAPTGDEQHITSAADAERDKKAKKWAFFATFVHDTDLPPSTWTVDGVVQAEELTEETLRRAAMREGAKKPLIAVSAPLHLTISEWIGWHPPYSLS